MTINIDRDVVVEDDDKTVMSVSFLAKRVRRSKGYLCTMENPHAGYNDYHPFPSIDDERGKEREGDRNSGQWVGKEDDDGESGVSFPYRELSQAYRSL